MSRGVKRRNDKIGILGRWLVVLIEDRKGGMVGEEVFVLVEEWGVGGL